jgi:hypothetical protein
MRPWGLLRRGVHLEPVEGFLGMTGCVWDDYMHMAKLNSEWVIVNVLREMKAETTARRVRRISGG